METNKQLYDAAGDLLKNIQPLDLADDEIVEGYYYPDLEQIANAHADWIERVQFRYPELLRAQEQDIKPKKNKEHTLINRINKIKR